LAVGGTSRIGGKWSASIPHLWGSGSGLPRSFRWELPAALWQNCHYGQIAAPFPQAASPVVVDPVNAQQRNRKPFVQAMQWVTGQAILSEPTDLQFQQHSNGAGLVPRIGLSDVAKIYTRDSLDSKRYATTAPTDYRETDDRPLFSVTPWPQ
jgi:hypothetical protein